MHLIIKDLAATQDLSIRIPLGDRVQTLGDPVPQI